jgi:hypothetical protein
MPPPCAVQFQVPYEEIMGWKCSGFGFGEIKHAYSLSTTKTISEIFDLHDHGYGWGQIKKMQQDGEPEEGSRSATNPDEEVLDNPHGNGIGHNADLGKAELGQADFGQDIKGRSNKDK